MPIHSFRSWQQVSRILHSELSVFNEEDHLVSSNSSHRHQSGMSLSFKSELLNQASKSGPDQILSGIISEK